MAQIKSTSERFNRDLLDDGVLGPEGTPPAAISSSDDFDTDDREARLARLRSEIQLGIDDYEAGRFFEFSTAEELFNHIISAVHNDTDQANETGEDRGQGRS